LQKALASAELLLKPGGRLVVISFHSLEDREVKNFMNSCSSQQRGNCSWTGQPEEDDDYLDDDSDEDDATDFPTSLNLQPLFLPSFNLLRCGNKVVTPSNAEIHANPRARSAKMRVAERTRFLPLLLSPRLSQ